MQHLSVLVCGTGRTDELPYARVLVDDYADTLGTLRDWLGGHHRSVQAERHDAEILHAQRLGDGRLSNIRKCRSPRSCRCARSSPTLRSAQGWRDWSASTSRRSVKRTTRPERVGAQHRSPTRNGPGGKGATRTSRQVSSPLRARTVSASPLRLARTTTAWPDHSGTAATDQS